MAINTRKEHFTVLWDLQLNNREIPTTLAGTRRMAAILNLTR